MFKFHKDKPRYFQYQYFTSKEYIVPFVKDLLPEGRPWNVLEIGCGEAGVLKAFTEKSHVCMGIELYESRLENARLFMKDELETGLVSFLNKDIYDIDIDKDLPNLFDLIILKDVIEHIPNQEVFIPRLKDFLKPDGLVFFGFPPWQMPFGGHQQVSTIKALSVLPYFHMLPVFMYKGILRMFGENETKIKNLLEIKSTGISIEKFERIIKQSSLEVKRKKHWLFNPIYQLKFNLKPRKQIALVSAIPYLRNFITTAVYYVVGR